MVDVIVGSEGKGMFTGAGIPPGNMPIYPAKDGARPPARVESEPELFLNGGEYGRARRLSGH